MARTMPPVHHLACKVFINGRYIIVDATVDPPLGNIGLSVNKFWDGESDTLLPVPPAGEVEILPSVRGAVDEASPVRRSCASILCNP